MIDFKVKPDNGAEYEVKATSRDVLLWERTSKDKGATLRRLLTDLRISDMYDVAYLASKRTGQFDGTKTDFESTVELKFDLETDEDESEEDPTQSAA
ncbi:hypothetical protein [Amycolatopsis thermoflava]|uniref:hypothetical protein n=1 Tax=Amycolatopsis thermoflava TaxID=84480 RepID=UPI003654D61A